MNTIINIYKPIGWTPLQLISQFREKNPEYKDIKIGYAGRLDPMAHGVLLLMTGDATKEKDTYLILDKEYIFEVLFGFTTNTYDILGLQLNEHDKGKSIIVEKEKVELFVHTFPEKFLQPYPPFSSKTVNGKPLFWWSRQNRLPEITIPSRAVEIYSFELLSFNEISLESLRKILSERINLVKGDFRQEKILKEWKNILIHAKAQMFATAKFQIRCSSGTYVRSLTNVLGQSLGTGAIGLDILRTRVGQYTLDESIKV